MESIKSQVDSPKKPKLSESDGTPPTEDDGSASVSRTGRLRKPKVFFDPSDVDSKRRSLPIIEVKPKPKKSPKPIEMPPPPPPIRAEKSVAEKSTPNQKKCLSPSQIKAFAINKRRQTISTTMFENGCIVCTRSDSLKGRFVNCTDCMKRGHFTCLRTAKLYKTADTEKTWQCPTCKICEECREQKPIEDLCKCVNCYNSYHPKCINLNPKTVVKKKFTCAVCIRIQAKREENESAAKSDEKVKNDGFAGFSHDESSKTNENVASSSKSKKVQSKDLSDEIKAEPETSNSEVSTKDNSTKKSVRTSKAAENDDDQSKISVRKDLVDPYGDTEMHDVNDDLEPIKYNLKTAFTPHEDIPDVRDWGCDEVFTYFMATTNAEFANLLKENQIDGDALLLIKREDVLNRFNLKLGPALRLYAQIVALQHKNNNPILAWNEMY